MATKKAAPKLPRSNSKGCFSLTVAFLVGVGVGTLFSTGAGLTAFMCPAVAARREDRRNVRASTINNTSTMQINPRILKAVFGEITDPFLQTLTELVAARPSLAKTVGHLESKLVELASEALETMSPALNVAATTSMLMEPEPPTVTIIRAIYGPKTGGLARADVKWLLDPFIHSSVLRIPVSYPLVYLFGSKPNGQDGGGDNFLDIDAMTAAGLVNISVQVTEDGKLNSTVLISSARTSRDLRISMDDIKAELKRITTGKNGLEIGGPSPGFEESYANASTTDLVNFSEQTLWGTFPDGSIFKYKQGGTGIVHITDGSTLHGINNDTYDFVFGSHYLEHLNNPLQALASMKRVLKVGGYAVLILPRKESCFDWPRGHASLEEILVRYLHGVSESDMRYTNFDSWFLGNDLSRDGAAGTLDQFRARSIRYTTNKAIHTMVYDLDLLETLAKSLAFEVTLMGIQNSFDLQQWIFIKKT